MVLQGDASWLSEALQNILKNCMQSIGRNGCIEILGSDTFLYSELVIHDSGAGFCEEELGHVFGAVLPRQSGACFRIWYWFGVVPAHYRTAGRNHYCQESPAGRCYVYTTFSKVTNLSPKSHRAVRLIGYAIDSNRKERYTWNF